MRRTITHPEITKSAGTLRNMCSFALSTNHIHLIMTTESLKFARFGEQMDTIFASQSQTDLLMIKVFFTDAEF